MLGDDQYLIKVKCGKALHQRKNCFSAITQCKTQQYTILKIWPLAFAAGSKQLLLMADIAL